MCEAIPWAGERGIAEAGTRNGSEPHVQPARFLLPGVRTRQKFPARVQRAHVGQALAAEPDPIIGDEITSAFDTIVAAAIIQLSKDLRDRLKVAYVFIFHYLSSVPELRTDWLHEVMEARRTAAQ